jgi:hypothetical protein
MSGVSVQNRGRDRLEARGGSEKDGHWGLTRSLPSPTFDRRRPQGDEGYPIQCKLWCTPNASYANGREIGGPHLEVLELFVDDLDHVKALTRGDRVDEDIAVHANGVFGGEERVLVLAGSVDDGDIVLDALVGDLLEVGCLHGRVIWLNELIVDKLDDERRLACAACLSTEDGEGDLEGD